MIEAGRVQELVIICSLVMFGRMADMSLSTLRSVLSVHEENLKAAIVGFLEATVYFIAVKDALTSDLPVVYLAAAYGVGFALGIYFGGLLSRKLVKGQVTIQVITSGRNESVIKTLREHGYGISVMNINESEFGCGKYLVMTNIDKKQVEDFTSLVTMLDTKCFIMTQDTKGHVGGFNKAKDLHSLTESQYKELNEVMSEFNKRHHSHRETFMFLKNVATLYDINFYDAYKLTKYSKEEDAAT